MRGLSEATAIGWWHCHFCGIAAFIYSVGGSDSATCDIVTFVGEGQALTLRETGWLPFEITSGHLPLTDDTKLLSKVEYNPQGWSFPRKRESSKSLDSCFRRNDSTESQNLIFDDKLV